MLIITRRPGEFFEIGGNIKVTVLEIRGKEVHVRVEAPSDVPMAPWRPAAYAFVRDKESFLSG